jgi:hypothetical protein
VRVAQPRDRFVAADRHCNRCGIISSIAASIRRPPCQARQSGEVEKGRPLLISAKLARTNPRWVRVNQPARGFARHGTFRRFLGFFVGSWGFMFPSNRGTVRNEEQASNQRGCATGKCRHGVSATRWRSRRRCRRPIGSIPVGPISIGPIPIGSIPIGAISAGSGPA